MAILKIKDENGEIKEILALKGERGDTGPQGVQGPQGDIGPQGPKGTSVTDGMIVEDDNQGNVTMIWLDYEDGNEVEY